MQQPVCSAPSCSLPANACTSCTSPIVSSCPARDELSESLYHEHIHSPQPGMLSGSLAIPTSTNKGEYVLTLSTLDPLCSDLESFLDESGCDQLVMEAGTQEGMTKILDQNLWQATMTKMSELLTSVKLVGGIFFHFGTTFNKKFRCDDIHGHRDAAPEDKQHIRIETCMALRILQLITVLTR